MTFVQLSIPFFCFFYYFIYFLSNSYVRFFTQLFVSFFEEELTAPN